MKIPVLFFTVLLVCATVTKAQTDSLELQNHHKPLDFSFETGTSYFSAGSLGSGTSFFFAPGLSLKPNPKWNMNFKTVFSRQNNLFFPGHTVEHQTGFSPNPMYVSLYADGTYSFSEKLHLRGSVYKNINSQTGNMAPLSISQFGLNEMYSIGMFYNITRNIQIGAEIRYIDYNRPYFYNPSFPF